MDATAAKSWNRLMRHLFSAFLLLGLLTACRATGTPPSASQPGFQPITLTDIQLQTVQAGVKTMLDEPPTAALSAVKAASSEDGHVHVCGYVTYGVPGGAPREPLPFYVELSADAGTVKAERGQVGTTASKRSKIAFVCRHRGLG